jgi:hypothetical protein
LNGDIVELAFGRIDLALVAFRRFIALWTRANAALCARIVYVPGNHDHHVWELEREAWYRRALATAGSSDELPPLPHATPPTLGGAFRAEVLAPLCGGAPVDVVYPNLVLRNATGRAVVLHHGHFVEPLYRALTRLRRFVFPGHPPPRTAAELEADNGAWIEFVWSLLGRSGGAGEAAETLFEMLRYPPRVRAFASDLAARLAPVLRLPFLPWNAARRVVLRLLLRRVAEQLSGERATPEEPVGEAFLREVEGYLDGPVALDLAALDEAPPTELAFLFGHTHKPFEAVLPASGARPRVGLLNSGGWTVDTDVPAPAFGASLLLLSHDLEAAAIRVFNDDARGGELLPEVRTADGGPPSPFVRRLTERVERSRPTWRALGAAVGEATLLRRERHRARFGHVRAFLAEDP